MSTRAGHGSPGQLTDNQYRGAMWTRTSALFFTAALVLWVITVLWANDMGAMPGTMGMGIAEFVLMWGLMMSAMMLPSVAPMTLLYSRSLTSHKRVRQGEFAVGYVLAWTLVGLAAYALAWIGGRLAAEAPIAAHVAAVVTFTLVGLYQLTPWKFRCLEHCRSPLGHLFHYASFRGRLRHVRAGLHHGLFCLGCCWALMVLIVVFGVMNIWAMVVLALVVATEKLWRHGAVFARAAGCASLALAVVVAFVPGVAPGLDPDKVMPMSQLMSQ
jgi:predicted metal-binding membrane protein